MSNVERCGDPYCFSASHYRHVGLRPCSIKIVLRTIDFI